MSFKERVVGGHGVSGRGGFPDLISQSVSHIGPFGSQIGGWVVGGLQGLHGLSNL